MTNHTPQRRENLEAQHSRFDGGALDFIVSCLGSWTCLVEEKSLQEFSKLHGQPPSR